MAEKPIYTFEWQLRRLLMMMRDDFKCVKCGGNNILHVHHKVYDNKLKYWEYPDDCLVTLCSSCHDNEHKDTPIIDFYDKVKSFQKFKFPAPLMKALGKRGGRKVEPKNNYSIAVEAYSKLRNTDANNFKKYMDFIDDQKGFKDIYNRKPR